MIRMHAASVAVALSLGMMLLAPSGAVAKPGGGGSGAHPFHSVGPRPPLARHPGAFRPHRPGAFRGFPWFGGGVVSETYQPTYPTEPPLQMFVLPPEPPPALDCHRSHETVTVPSEDGGTREIKITRC
jgi:hypothetical protein